MEDRARGEVERIVAGVVAVARGERAARRQDLDLIRLVRADVEVSLYVELDPIRTVQSTGSERRAVGEDRDRSSAAVFVDGDPQNAVVSGVCDVKETLRAIESNPVRAEGRVAVRLEQHVGLPQGLSPTARADRVDRARERVRDIEVRAVILRDRVWRAESFGENDERAGLRIDPNETSAGESGVVVGDVDTLGRVELTEERVIRRHGEMTELVPAQVVNADVPGETGRVQKAIRRCGDPFGVVTARVVRVREVPNDALRGLRGEDGLPR